MLNITMTSYSSYQKQLVTVNIQFDWVFSGGSRDPASSVLMCYWTIMFVGVMAEVGGRIWFGQSDYDDDDADSAAEPR